MEVKSMRNGEAKRANERNHLLERKSSSTDYVANFNTPGLRLLWTSTGRIELPPLVDDSQASDDSVKFVYSERGIPDSNQTLDKSRWFSAFERTPGLIIALVLNLFLSISFGSAYFPSSWTFPNEIPRSIGVQMFLLSTTSCQLFMTLMSDFPTAQGMMMVENIPFMHTIAQVAIKNQGMGRETFATVFVAFALSSIIVGIFFLLLGVLKLGNVVYFFPKHVILGCIGGIGIFLSITSIEVSTDVIWQLSFHQLRSYLTPETFPLLLATVTFEIILLVLLHTTKLSILPPFYFVAITPIVYIMLFISRTPLHSAHEYGWFFPRTESVRPYLIWELFDFTAVDWSTMGQLVPTLISLTIFSLMHVPINIPSLSMTTKKDVEMNRELIAHGASNIFTGCIGGLQNYLCYCNSVLYFKCNGGGRISGILLTLLTGVCFFVGPSVVSFVPRCMAGCILLHIGVDLTKEALLDSRKTFDTFEYGTVVLITVVMTMYGMTAGLGAGVLCAAMTFTLQAGNNVPPIRAQVRATALRSSQWRNPNAAKVLEEYSYHIMVLQLQGTIFFANATILATKINEILSHSHGNIWYILLDFTQVVGIDSSAAETLAKIYDICSKYDVKLCYSRGSRKGFPCAAPLSESLLNLENQKSSKNQLDKDNSTSNGNHKSYILLHSTPVHVADSLDDALCWCEDDLIHAKAPLLSPKDPYSGSPQIQRQPVYLRQFQSLCGESNETVSKLLGYFTKASISAGTILWKQGDASDRAILLTRGCMRSFVEGEENTTSEYVLIGGLIGEYGLLVNTSRRSTVICEEDSEVFVLTRSSYESMVQNESYLAVVLSRICMAYLDHRVQHVANRMWGSHSVPI